MKQLLLGSVLGLAAGSASAQNSDWEYAATLYGWLPGLGVETETAFGTVDADVSASDLLSALDMAFMAAFEARTGPWSILGDIVYSDLSASQPTPFGALFTEAQVKSKLTLLSGYVAYRVYDTADVAIDLAGGFRAFDVDMTVSLTPGAAAGRSRSSSDRWINPVLGARAIVNFNEKWFGTAFVDFGGTGSDDNTWQALATVGYRFNERWSTQIGYRYLQFEHSLGGNDTTMSLSGALIGVTARF